VHLLDHTVTNLGGRCFRSQSQHGVGCLSSHSFIVSVVDVERMLVPHARTSLLQLPSFALTYIIFYSIIRLGSLHFLAIAFAHRSYRHAVTLKGTQLAHLLSNKSSFHNPT
jgi:hypothetical protein